MDQNDWADVDAFLGGKLLGADPVMENVALTNRVAGLPEIGVSPLQGAFLGLMVRATASARVLEIGTLGGYSAIWMARELPARGRLITLEADEHHAGVARQNIEKAGLTSRVAVIAGKAADSLRQLADQGIGPFDLIFIDADKAGLPDYLDWALKLARPGTMILADNVVRNGEVSNPLSRNASVTGARTFLEMVGSNPRLTATALQTVGAKGWDGIAIVMVGE
jgi:predicted O-methyltransferase YrrM